jgi:hypothetical protein
MSDDTAVYVESCGERYKVARLPDFVKFRTFALSQDQGWTEAYKKEGILVESRPPEATGDEKPTGLNIVRVNVDMPTVDPQLLYDSLHDPDYRKSWDQNMLAGFNIVQLDERNDIGYYAAKFPAMITNRDFCNLRSWMEFTNGEYLIMNHSEPHRDCPEKKGFIRAKSIITGYYIRPRAGGGCSMVYITQSDLKGSLPHWLLNMGLTKMAPTTMKKLEECALNYVKWAEENRGEGFVGKWRTPKVSWDGEKPAPPPAALSASPAKQLAEQGAAGTGSGEERGEPEDEETIDLRAEEGARKTSEGRSSLTGGAVSNEMALQLQQQVEDLKRQLQIAQSRGGGSYDSGLALAPVAPSRPDDTPAVQQYRALMNDAVNFIDRQYVQEGRIPTLREYLIRLHCVVEAMQRTIPAAQQ